MARFSRIVPILVGLAMVFLNTDFLVPFSRATYQGSALLTVVVISILANAKVVIAFRGLRQVKLPESGLWMRRAVQKCEAPAIVLLALVPFPGLRTFCTAWCSVTQSRVGLAALLLANPVHVWSLVWGSDWILAKLL